MCIIRWSGLIRWGWLYLLVNLIMELEKAQKNMGILAVHTVHKIPLNP